jgi:hypothetical protein
MPLTGSVSRQAGSGSARKRSRSARSSHRLEESRRAQNGQSVVNVSASQAPGSGNQTGSNLHGATGSLSEWASGAKFKPSGDPEIVNIFQDWAREGTPDPQPGIHGEDSPVSNFLVEDDIDCGHKHLTTLLSTMISSM